MNYNEIKNICKKGKVGLIPDWKGYVKYDYSTDELYFLNKDYIMKEFELKNKIINRNDLYYII